MGTPTWDFSRSWASNLTAITGILGIAISFGALPVQTYYVSRQTSGFLAVFFLGLAALAPFLYFLFARIVVAQDSTGTPYLYPKGFVATFLIAAFLTAWGVLGQLSTLMLLCEEMKVGRIASGDVVLAFQGIILVSLIGLLFYLPRTIYWTIKIQSSQKNLPDTSNDAKTATFGEAPKSWPLL